MTLVIIGQKSYEYGCVGKVDKVIEVDRVDRVIQVIEVIEAVALKLYLANQPFINSSTLSTFQLT